MKIGELAKKNHIPTSTIYYYIDTGLLIPEIRDKRYDFSLQDEKDLNIILTLKKCLFSLEDIHSILSLIRMTNLADNGDIYEYLAHFGKQKHLLEEEKRELDEALKAIEKEIQEKAGSKPEKSNLTGVPLSMVELLYCPYCQNKLDILDAYIKNNQIISSRLLCECGYEADITDGILITKGLYLTKYEVPDVTRSFMMGLPAETVNIFKKAFNWMLKRITYANTDRKVVLEDHMNTFFFLYPNILSMNKNSYYIIVDKFLPIVEMYKERIEALNLNLNVLYMVNSSHEYPLKNGCVDIFIDFFSSNKFNFVESYYYLDQIYRLFNPQSLSIGTFFYYERHCKSIQEAVKQYDGTWENAFNVADFKDHFLKQKKFVHIEEQEIGTVTHASNEYFTYHIDGEKMQLLAYMWQKMAQPGAENPPLPHP